MSIWDVALALVALPTTLWLLRLAERWWRWSQGTKACCSREGHQRCMAEWERYISDAQAQLDYYLATPNWFDLEWPVCDSPVVSSDGEYCRNCYRQLSDHAMRVAA